MWPLLILGLAAAGYWAYANRTLPLHGGSTDSEIQKTAAYALQNEHDPNVLKTLALKLDAAGYHDLAAQLSARADQLAHSQGMVPAPMTLGQIALQANAPVTVQAPAPIAPQLGQTSLGGTINSPGIHAPRYIVSGNFPNGYPQPSAPLPYVTITTPVRR